MTRCWTLQNSFTKTAQFWSWVVDIIFQPVWKVLSRSKSWLICIAKVSKENLLPCHVDKILEYISFISTHIYSYFDRHPIWRVETWSTGVSRWNGSYCNDHYAWQCSHQMHECSSASDGKERETNHHVRERRHGRNNLAVLINNGKNVQFFAIVQFCHNTSNTFSIFRKPKNGQKKIVSLRFLKP